MCNNWNMNWDSCWMTLNVFNALINNLILFLLVQIIPDNGGSDNAHFGPDQLDTKCAWQRPGILLTKEMAAWHNNSGTLLDNLIGNSIWSQKMHDLVSNCHQIQARIVFGRTTRLLPIGNVIANGTESFWLSIVDEADLVLCWSLKMQSQYIKRKSSWYWRGPAPHFYMSATGKRGNQKPPSE